MEQVRQTLREIHRQRETERLKERPRRGGRVGQRERLVPLRYRRKGHHPSKHALPCLSFSFKTRSITNHVSNCF